MTAHVIPLHPTPSPQPSPPRPRPSRARPRPSRPDAVLPDALHPVRLEWDGARELYIAECQRCCETFTTARFDQAHEWAETHTCDPELVSLLDAVTEPHLRTAA